MKSVRESLVVYIEQHILPCYNQFDEAHRRNHVDDVIRRSMELAGHYEVNPEMVYVVAAYHDVGLCEGRECHHETSGRIIRNDVNLLRWFDNEQIATMAQAAEDHRASLKGEPRSIYGKIVAEADRLIEPLVVIQRAVQYGVSVNPDGDKEYQYRRCKQHLIDKYSETGYLRLWLPESENAAKLKELRQIIRDEERLHRVFEKEYERIKKMNRVSAKS